MEVSGQLHSPAAFSPRKEPPYPSDRRLGGPQSRCVEEKNIAPAGNRIPALQPLGRRYADWAIPTPIKWKIYKYM
jgi:hypothetical protein